MKKLFRITLKRYDWEHSKSLYVIDENKDAAIAWVKQQNMMVLRYAGLHT